VKGATALCPACRAPAAEDARFCSRCGAPLGASDLNEARRTVTALFADVVGSTPLAERLDPEDFRTVVGEAISIMATAVETFGGTVEHVAGDGLLALFGAPQAHEDDAERAVLAGLRLVGDIDERAAELAAEWSIERLAVRVGIETGLVVVGPLAHVELTVMGDSVNTAARLEQAARPGTVLVGERTRRLVEPAFEWGERHELLLKGKAEAVVAMEALSPRERRDARPAAPLVGREQELAQAHAALDDAISRGGVLVVLGEPGIGKSRLLFELHRRWAGSAPEGSLWLGARCVSYGRALPYLPFRQLLRDPALMAEAPELDPALAAIIGAEPAKRAPADTDPAELRRRGFEAVRSLLARRAARGPLVLALDDVHWADASSVALALHLFRGLVGQPILLVVVTRPDREGPARMLLEAARRLLGDRVHEVRLQPLTADTDRRLLEALLGAGVLPPQLEHRILARAEGNPFYLEELARSLVDAGALAERDGRVSWVGGVDVELPDTVERLVLARIDRLPPRAREVARAASVLGRQFAARLLEAVAGPDVPSTLLELERQDVVHHGGRGEYRFKHTLIQEAVYASLVKRRRQLLHSHAALSLEHMEPGRHGLLAHHWSAAGDHDRALTEHERAAETALEVYALAETAEHARLGLEAGELIGLGSGDRRVRELIRMRGRVRFLRDDHPGAARDFRAALHSARAAGDRRGELSALVAIGGMRSEGLDEAAGHLRDALPLAEELGDLAATVDVLSRHSILDAVSLRLDSAQERAERAHALAERSGEERLVGRALDAQKLVALLLGDLPALERLAGAAAAIHRRQRDPFFLSWAVLESAYVPLGQGRFDEARALIEEALDLNADLGDNSHRALFLDPLGWLERSRGEYATAAEIGREAHALSRRLAPPDFVAWTAATLGWTLLEAGEPDRAAAVLADGLGVAEKCEAAGQVLRCAGLLAAAEAERGGEDRAAAAADRAELVMRKVSAPPGGAFVFGGHATLAVAEVRLGQGEVAAARRLASPLLDAAARNGWVETEARAALVLSRCRRERGEEREAARLRERALDLAGEVGLPGVRRAAGSASPLG
jgi:class 3 adenylate cyclase/tetratricopeptide (TPR) repeat protein